MIRHVLVQVEKGLALTLLGPAWIWTLKSDHTVVGSYSTDRAIGHDYDWFPEGVNISPGMVRVMTCAQSYFAIRSILEAVFLD